MLKYNVKILTEDGSVDFDLIFLDIFLEGMLEMEAARCVRPWRKRKSAER